MDGSKRRWLGGALGLAAAVLLAWGPPQAPARAQAQGGDVVVFAAASLKNALDAVNAQWQKETGKKADDLLCRELGARQADRAGRAGADVHLGRSRLDGLSRAEEPDQARHALQPARQPHRADRAQGQGAADRDQAGLRPRQGCWATGGSRWPTSMPCRPASTARRRSRSSASGAACRGKVAQAENVRAALLLVSRGEAPLGIVYQTDAAADPQRRDHRHLPGGHASADHLSGRADGRAPPIPTPRPSSPTQVGARPSRCSRRRASRC